MKTEIERKAVQCLKCDKIFVGSTNNRICPPCNRVNEETWVREYRYPRTISSIYNKDRRMVKEEN